MLILMAYANPWGGGNNTASGYYTGDGTGYYNIRVNGNSGYRNVSCISSTPREIILPISPRILILITDSTQSILVVTSSTSLYYYLSGAATWNKDGTGSSSNSTIGPVQYSAVSISDNKLQLLNTSRVTETNPTDGGTLNFYLQHIYSTYDSNNSDNNIEATLYNNTNEKYYYIAW